MNWETSTKSFGHIRKNTSKEITFKALPGIPKIVDMQGSCGCTQMEFNQETQILTVTYKAGEIPKHLGNSDQRIFKVITIFYEGGATDVLTITGIKTH